MDDAGESVTLTNVRVHEPDRKMDPE